MGNRGYAQFVKDNVSANVLGEGLIKRYPTGEVLGGHKGIHQFTYGQRKGLGLDYHESLFVLKIDPISRTVWVGEEKYLFTENFDTETCNLLDKVEDGERLRVKIRHHHSGAWAKLFVTDKGFNIRFEEPQRAVTPGQAAVFYRDSQLVGGGWIV